MDRDSDQPNKFFYFFLFVWEICFLCSKIFFLEIFTFSIQCLHLENTYIWMVKAFLKIRQWVNRKMFTSSVLNLFVQNCQYFSRNVCNIVSLFNPNFDCRCSFGYQHHHHHHHSIDSMLSIFHFVCNFNSIFFFCWRFPFSEWNRIKMKYSLFERMLNVRCSVFRQHKNGKRNFENRCRFVAWANNSEGNVHHFDVQCCMIKDLKIPKEPSTGERVCTIQRQKNTEHWEIWFSCFMELKSFFRSFWMLLSCMQLLCSTYTIFRNSFHPNIQHKQHQYQFHFIFFGTKCDRFSFIRIEKVIFLCFHFSFRLLCWIHSFIHSVSQPMIRWRFGCLLSLDHRREKNE